MKSILTDLAIILSLMALTIWASERSHASDASSCYAVADADARAYCLAKARKDSSTCYTIQRADMRSMCLAEVRR